MARINHVALKVTDLEAATRFYENVFGFRQVKTGRSRGHISRHLTDGYVDLALMVYDSEEDPEAKLVGPGPAIHHFGVEVDDHDDFAERSSPTAARSCRSPARSRSNTAPPTAPSPKSCRRAATRK
jgi:lactoylglutathione lyase